MLSLCIALLLILWVAGLLFSATFGGLIHGLLILAIILSVVRLLQGTRDIHRLDQTTRSGAHS